MLTWCDQCSVGDIDGLSMSELKSHGDESVTIELNVLASDRGYLIEYILFRRGIFSE